MKNFLTLFTSKKLVLFSFLLMGFFVTSEAIAQADAKLDNKFTVPQGPFVDVATAITTLDNTLLIFKGLLSNMDPTSQAYRDLQAKYVYFEAIKTLLEEGKETGPDAVAKAIADGLSVSTTDAYGGIDTKKVLTFKQDVILLLRP